MTRDDMNRWEAEIDGWRQRYEALLKTLADHQSIAPPMMLADKQSYELGLLHGAAAEREACAKAVEIFDKTFKTGGGIAGSIRARGEK